MDAKLYKAFLGVRALGFLTLMYGCAHFKKMSNNIHIIKLVAGMESLEDFAELQKSQRFDYHGEQANVIWTRNKPKRADELVNGGSAYRVIKNRICCRQRILGFEEAQDPIKGKMTLIIVASEIMQTLSKPKRPFQGWRYLKPEVVPRDKGVFLPGAERPPEELEKDLRAAGLL